MGRALAEHGAVEIGRIERRAFMGAAMGALLGGCGSAQGKASPSTDTPRRVAVIGAGLAGLHCAYRLWQADSNMEVSVYDANTRWGGRVFTGRNLFADKTLACELGGEFIEAEHATMLSLATELGIALEDREQSLDGASHTYYANGAEISEEELLSQLSSVGPAMLSALSAADDNTQNFRLLDNTRLDEFLERNVPEAKYPQLLRLLNVAFRAEFGMETDVLSTLNLWRLFPLAATRITALSGNARREPGTKPADEPVRRRERRARGQARGRGEHERHARRARTGLGIAARRLRGIVRRAHALAELAVCARQRVRLPPE
jgi:monoamine oxidase